MSKPAKAKVTRTSVCNCGQVEIAVTGIDKNTAVCHCLNCKSSSGSAFAHNHRFMEAELEIRQGEDKIKEYADGNTKTGNVLRRHFCTNCVRSLELIVISVPYF